MNNTAIHSDPFVETLQRVLSIHFDPLHGTPYWLEQKRKLGIVSVQDITNLDQLSLFGPMDHAVMADRPIEDFIPRCFTHDRTSWIVAETGGTLGNPKFAVHRDDEFHRAFVLPFIKAAKRIKFPKSVNWLFIGPTGPHIIAKAARACATALHSPDPFTIDFDPRWAKKLPDHSFARQRYLQHVESQALRIIDTQTIGVLFSTPIVLHAIAPRIPKQKRLDILGIHFGGMSVSVATRMFIQDLFPHAVLLSGFGNTLVGMAPELKFNPEDGIDYYAHGTRLMYQCIDIQSNQLNRIVNYGERGRIVVHRLDEMQFIPNMIERDTAIRIPPMNDMVLDGFVSDGIRDPQPIVNLPLKKSTGLY